MNIAIINGCDEDNLFQRQVVKNLCKDLEERSFSYTINALSKIKPCMECDSCQRIKPGICAIKDGLNEILKQYLKADMAIIVTPIIFGTCNSRTKGFIDRTEPLGLPYQGSKNGKTMMEKRYDKYPDIIFVGIDEKNDINSNEAFKNTVINCNLALNSNNAKVKIITGKEDLRWEEI